MTKNMVMQILINFIQILVWPVRSSYRLSLYQFEVIWTYANVIWTYGPKKLQNFLLCYMGKWTGGLPLNYEGKFSETLNNCNSYLLIYKHETCREIL